MFSTLTYLYAHLGKITPSTNAANEALKFAHQAESNYDKFLQYRQTGFFNQ